MRFPHGLRALNHRDFRVFWTGQLVSLIGTWMQTIGQSWLVLQLTNSPFKLGVLGALQFGPMLLFSFVAGVIADRFPKRRLIILAQLTLLVQAFTLAALVWTGRVRFWHVAVLATLLGIANTVDMPTRQSFVADMVGKDDLMNAIALNSAIFNAARVLGPAAAGLLVARYGVGLAFFLNGLSFVAVILALLTIRTEGLPRPRPRTTVVEEIAEGVRYAVRTPRIALVLSLLLAVSLFIMNFNVLVPLLAREVLHQGAEGFGLLMASFGGGALAGALALAVLGSARPRLAIIVTAALVASGGTLGMSGVTRFGLAAPILGLIGFAGILFMASCNTTLQITAPDELRGRMMSLYTLVFAGVVPIGSFLVGSLAETFGVPAAFFTSGALGLASIGAVAARWRAAADRATP